MYFHNNGKIINVSQNATYLMSYVLSLDTYNIFGAAITYVLGIKFHSVTIYNLNGSQLVNKGQELDSHKVSNLNLKNILDVKIPTP